jgi:hypothetical protein
MFKNNPYLCQKRETMKKRIILEIEYGDENSDMSLRELCEAAGLFDGIKDGVSVEVVDYVTGEK